MNWTKFTETLQQPLFFLSWLILCTAFLFLSWKGLVFQEERQAKNRFDEIIDERDRICSQFENSQFKNATAVSDFKTKLVKSLLQS